MSDDRFYSHRSILGGRAGFHAYGWDEHQKPASSAPTLAEALRQCAAELGSIHHASCDLEQAKAHSAGLRMAFQALSAAEESLPEGYDPS